MVYAEGERRHLPEACYILYVSDPHRLVRNYVVHSPCAVKGVRVGEHYGSDDGLAHGAAFWGYAGSTGQGRSQGGMVSFSGLSEGFRKLG